ncbi:MAG: hypothetical protein SOX14_00560 [Ruminococcus callidus]|nr:hypothetical protein [Ruminococcus callidus]
MKVKDFEFNRDFLKHTNFKNGYHVYTGMEIVSDTSGEELPDSVIKLLYRIYAESVNNEETEV